MKPVYDAASVIDAHLVRHALEAAGIPVFLKGEALAGGMGELPLFGLVQVCVPDIAWPEAAAIVAQLPINLPTPDSPAEPADCPAGWLPA